MELHHLLHVYHLCRPEGLAEFLEEAVSLAMVFEGRTKVVLTGSPLALEDTALIEMLGERGVSVLPINCTGTAALEAVADAPPEDGDIVRHLALEAFHAPPCARARPNREVFERIGEAIRDSGASGLIVKALKFCDQWYTERVRMGNAFGVPVLVLDSVYSEGERGRLGGRLDAFLEVVG
jgi:benzoyl-CoA reductase/2-hydroxyglutaryl-CoA dehydratase subunit BcrC/BadD/HgdB